MYFERALEASQGSNIYAQLRLGDLLWRAGEQQEAEKHLAQVDEGCRAHIELGSENWFDRWALAVSAAVRDEEEGALDWLRQAVDHGRLHYGWDLNEPAFENLREQPEFQRLMDRMRAKTEEMNQRVRAAVERGELLLVPEEYGVNSSRVHP